MTAPANGREALVTQVRQRVSGRLRLGFFKAGDRVPSVRTVARELGVDPRIALAAYQQLAAEGILELRPRSGVFVAEPRDVSDDGAAFSSDREVQWLIDQFTHALETGIAAPSFPEMARRAFETLRLRAVVLDNNDDQLWSTTDELTRDYGFETTAVDLDALRGMKELPPSIHRADVIVSTSMSSTVERIAKRSRLPIIGVTMCPDLFAEVRRLLREQAVYFVVSDSRFARKLRTLLAPARGATRFHALVYGEDDLRSIPANAPLYVTRLTRQRMESGQPSSGEDAASSVERQLLDRVLPEARVFSAESARELIAFVIRANLDARQQSTAVRSTGR